MRIAICDDDPVWNRYASEILTEYLSNRNDSADIKKGSVKLDMKT